MPNTHKDVSARIRTEVWTALAVLFGLTGLMALGSWLFPWAAGVLQSLLAVWLLVVPSWALRRSRAHIDDMGVGFAPWRRSILNASMMMLIVFPPFIAGYHLVVTELGGLSAQWSTDKLTRWDETLEDPPHTSCNREREHVSAWVSDDALWVIPPSKSRLSLHAIDHQTAPRAPLDTRYLTVRCGTSGPITFRQAQARILDVGDGLRYDPPVGLGLRIPLKDATRIDARVHLDGQKVPATRLKTGRWGEEAGEEGKIEGTRSLGWIPIYIIVHLGLIALPEEWFFRGYLQTRIDQVMGTRWHWFGVQCGPGLVLSSAAFALLHPVLIPGFNRLLVFFPGLLFGWLRARTGNIGASVMFHAACNLLLAIVSGFYS